MTVLDPDTDAQRVYETMKDGGVAVIPLDVAYAVFGMTAEAIQRIYTAKGRSFSKPNGTLANRDIFHEVHDVDTRAREVVAAITEDYDLPLSIVGKHREGNAFTGALDPFCFERSTKSGTIDLLLNAGPLHRALTAISWQNGTPVMGSSANVSLGGSKFRLQDVEAPVLDAAAIKVDYGLCRYNNPMAISSTIIDVDSFEVHRFGVCYEQIRDILNRHFSIEIPPMPDRDLVRGAAVGEAQDA
ncbi:Sua5/YciO/YrdC/YwlC family protein [Roseovarius sp.]|uniref:Sua5/YciO/YrdC/YwlC family protein n=1 Tax=Roseovarius sp. TaxID=1486281 RepID=UPI002614C938|nr:Sua5/YciO/YrdC/YwlC family protein [Roseovarius sp.]MDM8165586.1 Sua5/YciO/YrdC/YwlC family protein [Roseovarius sp.]